MRAAANYISSASGAVRHRGRVTRGSSAMRNGDGMRNYCKPIGNIYPPTLQHSRGNVARGDEALCCHR